MRTDSELLHRYTLDHEEDALADLVRRHVSLVYATALRRGSRTRHVLTFD